jgi:hypothetical protein
MNPKVPILLFSALLTVLPAEGSTRPSPDNRSATDVTYQLMTDLSEFERMVPTGNDRERVMACLGHTFLKWANSYHRIMAVTPLDYPSIKVKLDYYATHWYRVRHNMAVSNFYYPNIESGMDFIFRDASVKFDQRLKLHSQVGFTIDDIDRKTYNQHLFFCLSRYFLARSIETIPEANEGEVLPAHIGSIYQGTAYWKPTSYGGLEPALRPGTGLNPPEIQKEEDEK